MDYNEYGLHRITILGSEELSAIWIIMNNSTLRIKELTAGLRSTCNYFTKGQSECRKYC